MRALFGPRERPLARGRATLLILRPRTRGSSDGNEGGQGDSGEKGSTKAHNGIVTELGSRN